MSIASLIRAMSDAGAPAEAIALAVEAIEARDNIEAARKAKRAAQKAKERLSHDIEATVALVADDIPFPDKEKSPTPPKEINPIPISEVEACARGHALAAARTAERKAAFAKFWAAWPHKVAKPEAEKAFAKVWTEAEAIHDGIGRYIAQKPSDRAWMHASTFLNQRRWEDIPAPVGQPPARAGPEGQNGSKFNGNHGGISAALREIKRKALEREAIVDFDSGGCSDGGPSYLLLPKG